jgi:hypothetical protein
VRSYLYRFKVQGFTVQWFRSKGYLLLLPRLRRGNVELSVASLRFNREPRLPAIHKYYGGRSARRAGVNVEPLNLKSLRRHRSCKTSGE